MDAAANADSELVERIKDGDVRSAGALLVTRFADEVYALCRAMVRDPVEAEDLSQDVFGRAFASLRSFRGEATPRTWILRIARNRCIDHLRAQKRTITAEGDEPDAQPSRGPLALDSLLWRTDGGQPRGVL